MKAQWEEDAKAHFIAELKAQGRGDWAVSATDVVVDKSSNRNFDYQLRSEDEFIALELFRLVEGEQEIARSKVWTKIANGIAEALRKRGVKGYTIHSPNFFNVPQLKIPGFVSNTADLLEAAIKQNPNADSIPIDGYEIQRIKEFPDVSLFVTGPGGPVNPTGNAYEVIVDKLPIKNAQLDIANHERIILIVNWALLVDRSNMIEACSLVDFSQFKNIDKVYFELPNKGGIHLVYDRRLYEAFQPNGEPPEQIEPLFVSWLANLLERKDPQALSLVRKIAEREKSLLWLPTLSREQLVSFGEEFLQKHDWEQLDWIINNLEDDPAPSVENAPDDPEGKFNVHVQTKNGESSRIIHTVRGRLCWLLMRMVASPCINEYNRIFEIIEKYAIGENLFVRLHATVPLIELARRRFATVDGNTRFMSDELAERVKKLALRMVDENSAYPAVLEWIAHVTVCIGNLDHDTALNVIQKLLTIDKSEAAPDISWMMIYFANNATKILNAANPAFTATYSGFVNGDTPGSLSGTLTCTTTTATSPVGSYPINCSGLSSSNYTTTYQPGTLKILYASSGICDGSIGHQILPPINADGSSVYQQSKTVPAKFRVCDANGVSVGTAGVVSSFNLTGILTGTGTITVQNLVDTNNPDNAFHWDPTDLLWIFNISTKNLSAGYTYVYTILLNDGTTINFQYGLR